MNTKKSLEVEEGQQDYKVEVSQALCSYASVLIGHLTRQPASAVRKALAHDTECVLNRLMASNLDEIPDELVTNALRQQLVERLSEWGLSTEDIDPH